MIEYPSMAYPEWQRPLFDALITFDHGALKEKAHAAERVIRERLQELRNLSHEETQALNDGLLLLAQLTRHDLATPRLP